MMSAPLPGANTAESLRVAGGLNWGALVLTPYWLIRNGFLVSFVLYILLSTFVWPLDLVLSVLFFVWGTEWSWGKGRRWKSYEEFADSQYVWGLVAKTMLIAGAIWLASLAYVWARVYLGMQCLAGC